MENENLLKHAFINQIEYDFNEQDYSSISEMLKVLIKNKDNKKIIIEYLNDNAKDNWLKGITKCRF